jgi:hypothetical protein
LALQRRDQGLTVFRKHKGFAVNGYSACIGRRECQLDNCHARSLRNGLLRMLATKQDQGSQNGRPMHIGLLGACGPQFNDRFPPIPVIQT